MIRVAVIDDHVVVRAGLKYLLESDQELSFCGEWGGGVGAADFVGRVQPDVTLLDVRMPDRGGIDALHDILEAHPHAKMVMLTTSDAPEDVFRAIDEGARGYVMKEAPIETITAAIRAAASGEIFMSDELRLVYETRKAQPGLARRESEVLGLVSQGLNNREIGARLGISENSVKMHLKRIYFKLNVNDRTEAVRTALERGMLR